MTLLVAVLTRKSLRGVKVGCSPAPTYAMRLVQNSISAILQHVCLLGDSIGHCIYITHSGQKGWQQIQDAQNAALPDCAKVGLIKYFVSLQTIDFYALVVGYRYACVVLVKSQI